MPPFSPVLLCFATEDEARSFRPLARCLDGVELLLTGVGAANALRRLDAALDSARGVAAVINAGFAGGLDPALRHGALVCESSHAPLLWAARDAGCVPVTFTQADRILITPEEKRARREASGADAVDMESAALRAGCARRGLPFLNLRVISDAADESLPLDFNRCFSAEMQFQLPCLLLELAKSPARLPALLAFHRAVRQNAATLARALTATLGTLRGNGPLAGR
jgi:nucleoside phosphorylase